VTLPALQALRERWPDGYIELLAYPHIANLAVSAGLANRVTSLHGAQAARFFSLRPEFPPEQQAFIRSFDLVLSYLHDPDGVVRANLAKAGARDILYGSPLVETEHAVDHLVKPLERLALYAQGATPRLCLGAADAARGPALLAARGAPPQPYLLHPGSGSPKKNWPARHFIELARLLDARAQCPLFLVGEADQEVADFLRRKAPDIPLLSGLDLPEVAGVLCAASAYVGNDSGISHLAAALGRPALVLFGPSNPDLWSPRGARVLRAPDGDLSRLSVYDVVGALPA
jgi:heptosyltransferase-3